MNPQGHESCLLVAAGVQFLRVAKLPRLIRDDGMCSRGLFIFLCHARGLSFELDSSLGKLTVVQSPCRAVAIFTPCSAAVTSALPYMKIRN